MLLPEAMAAYAPLNHNAVYAAEADLWQSERPELSSCSDADLVEDIRRFLEVGTVTVWASS